MTTGPLEEASTSGPGLSAVDLARILDACGADWRPAAEFATALVACRVAGRDVLLEVALDDALLHVSLEVPAMPVAPAARPALFAAVCRINTSLRLPGFQVDAEGGPPRFRATVPLGASGLDGAVLRDVMTTVLSTVDGHASELGSIGADPEGEDRYASVRACLNRPRATRPRRAADRPRSKAVIWDRLNGDVWGEIEGAVLRAFAEDRWVVSGLEELAAATRGRRLVASYAVRGERDPLAARLHALGFDDPYEEVVVERSLEGELPPLRKQVTLEDPGTVPIAALAEALQGTANRGLQCLKAAELASFLDHGVDRRAGWRIARLRDQQVGVANLRVDEPGVASLGFMGLAPAWRGRGLGAALHAAALRDLAAQGAGHYRDATDVRNRAMRSVFFWNGCTVVGFTRHRSAP